MLRTLDTTSQRLTAGSVTSVRACRSLGITEQSARGTDVRGTKEVLGLRVETAETMRARSFESPFTASPTTRPYHVVTQFLASNDIAGWAPKQKVCFSK